MDPRHWFESLPQYYTLGDLLLIETPGHDLQYPKKGIDDFDTSRRLIKLTNTARKKHGKPNMQVAGYVPYTDATPIGIDSITPWSFLISLIKRCEREKDFGRFFAGYEPEILLTKEFVGTFEA